MPEPEPASSKEHDWVFIAMFNCARCDREVTVRHYPGDSLERRSYRHIRWCADCSSHRDSSSS